MKLHTINTGFFKLDGGAMFGVVPKTMWQKLNPPDENNMCTWAMRCLLVEIQDRLILIDTGMGNKQDDKFRSHFHPHGEDSLEKSIRSKGFELSDVTDVILTHLHFDHCGGAVSKNRDGILAPTFPNAAYWSSYEHWKWAIHPNPREKASFLKENFMALQESGQLKFIEQEEFGLSDIETEFVYGHTESMIIVHVYKRKKTLSYVADLIPSRHHIRMPYVMAYDVRPLETMKEKAILLEKAYENDHILFFEHDKDVECCTLDRNDNGIHLAETFSLEDW